MHDQPAKQRPRDSSKLGTWWPLGLALVLGAFAGIASYTFSYAEGLSYFSTDPKACVNCHIMQPQYDGWQKASHHAAAKCVDCHLPQAFIPKYLAKAENGWRHGEKFTTQDFHEPIVVQAAGLRILQENCVRCHTPLVDSMLSAGSAHDRENAKTGVRCVHCHSAVGHGERAGLGGRLRAAEIEQPLPPRKTAPVEPKADETERDGT